MRYAFPGLSKHQRKILDQLGSGNSNLASVFPSKEAIADLLRRGLIIELGADTLGKGWSAVRVPVYEMPTPVHIKWCEWCAKQE